MFKTRDPSMVNQKKDLPEKSNTFKIFNEILEESCVGNGDTEKIRREIIARDKNSSQLEKSLLYDNSLIDNSRRSNKSHTFSRKPPVFLDQPSEHKSQKNSNQSSRRIHTPRVELRRSFVEDFVGERSQSKGQQSPPGTPLAMATDPRVELTKKTLNQNQRKEIHQFQKIIGEVLYSTRLDNGSRQVIDPNSLNDMKIYCIKSPNKHNSFPEYHNPLGVPLTEVNQSKAWAGGSLKERALPSNNPGKNVMKGLFSDPSTRKHQHVQSGFTGSPWTPDQNLDENIMLNMNDINSEIEESEAAPSDSLKNETAKTKDLRIQELPRRPSDLPNALQVSEPEPHPFFEQFSCSIIK